ncbi:hypothetical protein, partial [Acinetobacter baumannii]|uniref:hypothetical protein n=1 Tax=Acinetobacter baumannii TaxID=470 RepID=UPI001BB46C4A
PAQRLRTSLNPGGRGRGQAHRVPRLGLVIDEAFQQGHHIERTDRLVDRLAAQQIQCVDSSSKLSHRARPILSHLFVEEFGYSDVDKSTGISAS